MAFTESAISRALVVQTKWLPDRVVGHTNGLLEVLVNNELGALQDFSTANAITFSMIDTETGETIIDGAAGTGTDQGQLQFQVTTGQVPEAGGLFSCQWFVDFDGAGDEFLTRRILQRFIRRQT